jgi:hypothetical protein
MAFGALGVLLTQGIATARAPGRVAAGGKGVLSVPLGDVTGIRSKKNKIGVKQLVVQTGSNDYVFSVKLDKWRDDLSGALAATGRNVTATDDGFSVT